TRVEADRRVEVGERLRRLTAGEPGEGAVVQGGRGAGLEPQRGVEVGDGAVVVAHVVRGEPAAVVGQVVGRVEADRRAVRGDRRRVIGAVQRLVAPAPRRDGGGRADLHTDGRLVARRAGAGDQAGDPLS